MGSLACAPTASGEGASLLPHAGPRHPAAHHSKMRQPRPVAIARVTLHSPCCIFLAQERGIRLFTSHVRRGYIAASRLPPIQILLPQERGIRLFTSHVRRGINCCVPTATHSNSAAAGARHPAVHQPRAAGGPRRAGPGLEQPLQAQLHLRLHPGGPATHNVACVQPPRKACFAFASAVECCTGMQMMSTSHPWAPCCSRRHSRRAQTRR